MADVFSKRKRSRVMAAIRSKGNKDTEMKLVSIFRAYGIKGWRRHRLLPGKPDFIFSKARLAIFVDGCFWHGCPTHEQKPDSNRDYWP
jgi:DNA mismatch endonuclease (patch repair protein)